MRHTLHIVGESTPQEQPQTRKELRMLERAQEFLDLNEAALSARRLSMDLPDSRQDVLDIYRHHVELKDWDAIKALNDEWLAMQVDDIRPRAQMKRFGNAAIYSLDGWRTVKPIEKLQAQDQEARYRQQWLDQTAIDMSDAHDSRRAA